MATQSINVSRDGILLHDSNNTHFYEYLLVVSPNAIFCAALLLNFLAVRPDTIS